MVRAVALPGSVATLRVPWRPSFTANQARRMTPFVLARTVREWREGAAVLAVEQRLPRFSTPVAVVVTPFVKSRRGLQDCAACAPCAKAVLDGCRDAGVLVDDSPRFVRRVTFEAPVVGDDALVIRIEALDDDGEVA